MSLRLPKIKPDIHKILSIFRIFDIQHQKFISRYQQISYRFLNLYWQKLQELDSQDPTENKSLIKSFYYISLVTRSLFDACRLKMSTMNTSQYTSIHITEDFCDYLNNKF